MKNPWAVVLLAAVLMCIGGLPSRVSAYGIYEVSTTMPDGSSSIGGHTWGCFESCSLSMKNSSGSSVTVQDSTGWQTSIAAGQTVTHSFTTTADITSPNGFIGSSRVIITPAITATAVSSTSASVNWTAWQGPGSATLYNIYYQITTSYGGNCPPYNNDGYYGGGWVKAGSTTSTSYTIQSIGASYPYCAYVEAQTNGSMGITGSNLVSFRTPAATSTTATATTTPSTTSATSTTTTSKTSTNSTNSSSTSVLPTVVKFGAQDYQPSGEVPIHKEQQLTISGVAKPSSTLLITVHSDPLSQKVTTDANGAWTAVFDLATVGGGEHIVVAQYDNNGTLGEEVGVVRFQYEPPVAGQTGEAEATSALSAINTPAIPEQQPSLVWWLVGILSVAGLVVLAVVIRRRRRMRTLSAMTKPVDGQVNTTEL